MESVDGSSTLPWLSGITAPSFLKLSIESHTFGRLQDTPKVIKSGWKSIERKVTISWPEAAIESHPTSQHNRMGFKAIDMFKTSMCYTRRFIQWLSLLDQFGGVWSLRVSFLELRLRLKMTWEPV
ncbi:hypothetical protein TWF506_007201 [Arthrobotrys conoides]|uniref:Uncharacterized protein n=1 Tax=Arthrobotrys conoides TaxID=74498 RepID=A0AAN8PGY0_9PEZI